MLFTVLIGMRKGGGTPL